MTTQQPSAFRKATRQRRLLRFALYGLSGVGKTLLSLRLAYWLRRYMSIDGPIALIDAERGRGETYGLVEGETEDGLFKFDFLHLDLARPMPGEPASACTTRTYHPERYMRAMELARQEGAGVLILDQISHAWQGAGGLMEELDKMKGGSDRDSFRAWGKLTPMQRQFLDAILAWPGHSISTLRVKAEWVLEVNDKGKQAPRKVGMKAEQREGFEYEFDVVAGLDLDHRFQVEKTIVPELDGMVLDKPTGEEIVRAVRDWMHTAAAPLPPPPPPPPSPEPQATNGKATAPKGERFPWKDGCRAVMAKLDAIRAAGKRVPLLDAKNQGVLLTRAKVRGWDEGSISALLREEFGIMDGLPGLPNDTGDKKGVVFGLDYLLSNYDHDEVMGLLPPADLDLDAGNPFSEPEPSPSGGDPEKEEPKDALPPQAPAQEPPPPPARSVEPSPEPEAAPSPAVELSGPTADPLGLDSLDFESLSTAGTTLPVLAAVARVRELHLNGGAPASAEEWAVAMRVLGNSGWTQDQVEELVSRYLDGEQPWDVSRDAVPAIVALFRAYRPELRLLPPDLDKAKGRQLVKLADSYGITLENLDKTGPAGAATPADWINAIRLAATALGRE